MFFRQEVGRATALRDMEDCKAAGGFSSFPLFLILLPDFSADALILPLGELVAHLVNDILQVFLQRFIFQMLAERIVPTLVNPEGDILTVHCVTSISSTGLGVVGLGLRRDLVGADVSVSSMYSRTGAGTYFS